MPALDASPAQVRVGGDTWLTSLGWWGELTVTHRWPFGCWETTWQMALQPFERPRSLVRGASVELFHGPDRIWSGTLTDPNWDTGEFVAQGHCRPAETTQALTTLGESSSTPDAAIDAAIARGALNWVRPASLSSVPFAESDTTEQLNTVAALLDAWSDEQSLRWAVDADRRVYAASDPTTPAWYVMPGSGVLGVADEDYVTDVYGRYRTPTGTFATASAQDRSQGVGVREIGVDLTRLGRLSSMRAAAVCAGILAKTKARTGWTNGITVTPEQITTLGGVPAHPSLVVAGQVVRLQGLLDERGFATSTDVVLGETVWNVTAGTLDLNPVGLAARDLASIVAAAGGVLS